MGHFWHINRVLLHRGGGRLEAPIDQRPPDCGRRIDEARARALPGKEAAAVNEAHRRAFVGEPL